MAGGDLVGLQAAIDKKAQYIMMHGSSDGDGWQAGDQHVSMCWRSHGGGLVSTRWHVHAWCSCSVVVMGGERGMP